MQIKEIYIDGNKYSLTEANNFDDSNSFTILTGENGVGKSRLLKSICDTFLLSDIFQDHYNDSYRATPSEINYYNGHGLCNINIAKEHGHYHRLTYNYDNGKQDDFDVFSLDIRGKNLISIQQECDANVRLLITRFIDLQSKRNVDYGYFNRHYNLPKASYTDPIITVTSSPFDKFPIINKRNNYYYRGARTNKLGRGDELSIIDSKYIQLGNSFIRLFLKHGKNIKSVVKVFDFLGLNHDFRLSLKLGDQFGISNHDLDNLYSKGQSVSFFNNVRARDEIILDEEVLTEINTNLRESYYKISNYFQLGSTDYRGVGDTKVVLDFNLDSFSTVPVLEDIITLVDYNLVCLDDILFTKNDIQYGVKEASSGEACILFNILAIASELKDNSLILIDEPELSLHPKWQEEFMSLLSNAFENFKGCHFIISTHSPNIVLNLPEKNSYILDMTTGTLTSGSSLRNRSADYCMTHAFDVNSPNNEYLIRISLEIFFKLSKGERLSDDNKNDLSYLESVYDKLPDSELKKVISSCIEVWGMRGH